MTWICVMFEDAMTHVVHKDLAGPLIGEMLKRGSTILNLATRFPVAHARAVGGNPKVITEWAFDLGGMTHANMPVETLELEDLAIKVPCDQFEAIRNGLRQLPVRTFANGDAYHKLKLWMHATVFTLAQYGAVIRQMDCKRTAAARKAYEFAMTFQAYSVCGTVH